MSENWIYVDEIAAHLRSNPDTIYKWITRRSRSVQKLGLLWKSLASKVENLLLQMTRGELIRRTGKSSFPGKERPDE